MLGFVNKALITKQLCHAQKVLHGHIARACVVIAQMCMLDLQVYREQDFG